jgi:hypothetical protein
VVGVTILRAGHRFVTEQSGITTWHCFSSGAHYDPANVTFGALVGCDEHLLSPGSGFARHRHSGTTIVSWPIEGDLHHEGDDGAVVAHSPGTAQVLDTNAGTTHAEWAGPSRPTRFVQMTLLAGAGVPVGYREVPLSDGESITVVTSSGPATLTLVRGRPAAWEAGGPRFLFVVRGSVRLDAVSDDLSAAGAPLLLAGDSVRVPASAEVSLDEAEDLELLVWQL